MRGCTHTTLPQCHSSFNSDSFEHVWGKLRGIAGSSSKSLINDLKKEDARGRVKRTSSTEPNSQDTEAMPSSSRSRSCSHRAVS